MKADNEQELLIGLNVMRGRLNVLIENLEKGLAFECPKSKEFLRDITLDLRELYKSFYLDKNK